MALVESPHVSLLDDSSHKKDSDRERIREIDQEKNRDRERERDHRDRDRNRDRERERERHHRVRERGRDKDKDKERNRDGEGHRRRKHDSDNEQDNKETEKVKEKEKDKEKEREKRHKDKDDEKDREGEREGRHRSHEKRERTHRDRDRDEEKDRGRESRHKDREEEEEEREGHHHQREKSLKHQRSVNRRDNNEPEKKTEKTEPKPEGPVGKTGGVYLPPFRLAQIRKEISDQQSAEYQRMTWDALKKSINGLINKVNVSNIKNIIPELFSENLVRGKGLFARSCMKAQGASPNFTHVYAALIAVVNTKFPENGELIIKRLIVQFRKAYRRNVKHICLSTTKFLAHLVNQLVCGEIIALQLLTLLVESPTDDSVEVAVGFIKECGRVLSELAPQGFNSVFERFRGILHEGEIDKRIQYMIEGLFADRKNGFKDYPGVVEDLDLVDPDDQIPHDDISLEDDFEIEEKTNYFQFDPEYNVNEERYDALKKEILGEDSDESESEADDEAEEEEPRDEMEDRDDDMLDDTETDRINLRRTIYLTIMSSVDFEECAHKLLKFQLKPGLEMELCTMLIECCSQERTYLRFYGLLGQRFCLLDTAYQKRFDECFVKQYTMIHKLETNKLRNVGKFFAHLLHSDALPWSVLEYIHLNEDETTSSSRIFIKILFQEIAEFLGLAKLNERLKDSFMKVHFEGLFPKENPRNTRFAINFFTSIGLGGLTDDLREHLRTAPKRIMEQKRESSSSSESSSESGSSSSSSDSSDDSSSESSSSSSESDHAPKKRRRKD
eukprot:TRINITY_DN4399_c0_g1_i1.p1 TRINITY_DN4399_c0_g1~~TRINITY_DN4399_c0_g1_i1.p1  ORF type:complete len:785 (-),score=211.07 TRINITY_DN4399_c0_g1_i1:109-2463(-)